ncbi:MAG TPA: hypothetical protein VHL57_00500, partial [Flavobacteriales bacterium]|nr:hypothetical protein [Flavobacteriales bacterium]
MLFTTPHRTQRFPALFLLSLVTGVALAQNPPAVQWQRLYGGSSIEDGHDVRPTRDGGFVGVGRTSSTDGDVAVMNGFVDLWVVKVDAGGQIEWEHALGGTQQDEGWAIVQTPDDGFIVTGATNSMDGDVVGVHPSDTALYPAQTMDLWVVKLNASGALQWQRTLGGTGPDWGLSIVATMDGGCVVAGSTESSDGDVSGYHGGGDVWVVKLDVNGSLQWQRALGGSLQEYVESMAATPDGGFILTGMTSSHDGDVSGNHGGQDVWAAKLDANGGLQWQRCFGGSAVDDGKDILATTDGGYLLAGTTLSNDGDVTGLQGEVDAWVMKLDGSGALEWQRTMGGAGYEWSFGAMQAPNGTYVLCGGSSSTDGAFSGGHGGYSDALLFSLDAQGTLLWQTLLGGSGTELFQKVRLCSDGGFIVLGRTDSEDGDLSGPSRLFEDLWMVRF